MTLAPPLATQPGTPPSMAHVLDLEPTGENVLRGRARTPTGTGRMFGGEIAGQAVMAAHHDVPADRLLHSLHGYFLLPGHPEEPVDHHVDPTRDGGSFTTRTVRSVQGDGVVFTMIASFQRPESGIEHAPTAPAVVGPEESLTVNDLLGRAGETGSRWLQWMSDAFSWEVRFPDLPPRRDTPTDEPGRTWFRVRGDLGDDRAAHAAALTHGSDLFLLGSAVRRHGIVLGTPDVFVTSLDHTIWFHESPRVDEWLLYDQRSAWAAGGRALCRGRFWTTDGRLVATVAQEGLVRQRSA